MASMPSNNRSIRIMPENKANQAWAPLLATAGVMIDAARRSLVADVIARLMDAHMQSSPLATFAAVAHGIRFVVDGTTGAGAPCFVEAKGAATGEVYLFGCAAKRDALVAAIGQANVTSTRDEGSKGGLYITLAPDADAAQVHKVLSMHASVRGPVGYLSSMGAPKDLDAVTFDPATLPAPKADKVEAKADGSKGGEKAPKGKRGRPAKGAKADKVTEDAPSTEAASTEAA